VIGDAASNRRRTVVVAAVLLGHALLLSIALLWHTDHVADEPVAKALLVMTIDLPREELPPEPQPVKPRIEEVLQKLAPRLEDLRVVNPEIQIPDLQPVTATESPPAAAPVTDQAEAGLEGIAPEASGVSAGVNGLVLLRRVLPAYPPVSVRRGEQGITTVVIHIARNGRVDAARVGRTSGSTRLDRAALDAVRKWRFQKLPAVAAANGTWVKTDLRFVLYQFSYSRLEPGVTDSVYADQINPRPGTAEEATPGSEDALLRFVAAVRDGTYSDGDSTTRDQLAQMRAVLERWGKVQSAEFTGTVYGGRWMSYRIPRDFPGRMAPTVEVSWNMFEVRHADATSEWLIAVDRDGKVWVACGGLSPWT
jgi:periplasmic protein TonB